MKWVTKHTDGRIDLTFPTPQEVGEADLKWSEILCESSHQKVNSFSPPLDYGMF